MTKLTNIGRATIPRQKEILAAEAGDALMFMKIDTGEYLMMEDTARAIWDAVDGRRSVADIVDRLVVQYEIESEACFCEVRAFLMTLCNRGLIEFIDARDEGKTQA